MVISEKPAKKNQQGQSKQIPVLTFPEKGACPCHVTPKFFRVPPNISGTGKATKLKFGMLIYRYSLNKSP